MDISQYFELARRDVANLLDGIRTKDFLTSDADGAIDDLVERFVKIQEIEHDKERVVETKSTDRLLVYFPVVPDETISEVLKLRSNPQTVDPLDLRYEDGWIVANVTLEEGAVDRTVEKLEQKEIARRNANIKEGRAALRQFISDRYMPRRAQAEQERKKYEEVIAKSKVPIKMREAGAAQLVTLTRRRPPPRPARLPATAAAPSKQLILDPKDLTEIHRVIEASGLLFERTPATFLKLGEEDLRNVILSNLNSVFSEGATGETFSKRGDTDIFLRISEGGIFVAECKHWHGVEKYKAAMRQIFGYLTWRETFGTVICFVKTKDMTKVVETVRGEVVHGAGAEPLADVSATHLVSRHAHPDDGVRTVVVHHLFFNLAA